MTTYNASSIQENTSTTVNGIQVTAKSSATATSDISQFDAQYNADIITKQDAISISNFSANLLNQSIVINNLQQYKPIIEGYCFYSEIYQNETYITKTSNYSFLTSYAPLYDKKSNLKIGTWGNYGICK